MQENIKFSIGSFFKGEGFKKATQTVNEMNQNVKKGVEMSGQLSGVLGQVDSSAGRAVTAMTGMIQALMSMNATVIVSQTAMLALNLVLDDMKKKAEEFKARADELHASMEKAFSATMAKRMAAIKAEAGSIVSDFDTLTKQANAFTAALEGVRAAEANGGVVQLQVEKLNKLLEAHSEEVRQNIEQEYNLRIAIQKRVNTEEEWNEKIVAAHQAVVDGENRIDAIDEQLAIVEENRRTLEETMLAAKQSKDEHWREIEKNVNALKEEEAKLAAKRNETESQIDVLREKERAIKQEAVNAQQTATAEVLQAELAEKKLTEAKHEREVKEAAAKEAAELKEAADRADAQQVKSAADLQKEANDAAAKLKNAEIAYANALKNYNTPENLAALAARALVNGEKGLQKGILPVDVQKGIQLKTADATVDEAIRKGMVNTVKDADKLQRQAMREARDKITKEQTQQLKEAQKYKRLQEMNPKTLCSADKDFMQKYEKIQEAAKERKKLLDDAKKQRDDAKKVAEKTKEDLDKIVKKMEALGLK